MSWLGSKCERVWCEANEWYSQLTATMDLSFAEWCRWCQNTNVITTAKGTWFLILFDQFRGSLTWLSAFPDSLLYSDPFESIPISQAMNLNLQKRVYYFKQIKVKK